MVAGAGRKKTLSTYLLHFHRATDIDRLLALIELLLEPVNVVGPGAGKLGGRAAPASPHLDLADVGLVVVGGKRGRRERGALFEGAEDEVRGDTRTKEAV